MTRLLARMLQNSNSQGTSHQAGQGGASLTSIPNIPFVRSQTRVQGVANSFLATVEVKDAVIGTNDTLRNDVFGCCS